MYKFPQFSIQAPNPCVFSPLASNRRFELIAQIFFELNKRQGKRTRLKMADGTEMICIPKQFIEPEENNFLVEIERYGGYPKDTFIEISAEEIQKILP